MRIVDAEAKKPEGAENESVVLCRQNRPEQCELLLSMDDSPLLALEDRVRSINLHAPIIWTNFCKADSKALLNMSAFSGESVGEKNPISCNPVGLITWLTALSRLYHGVFQGLS